MRQPSTILRAVPVLAILLLGGTNVGAAPGASAHHAPRTYAPHARSGSYGYRAPRPRHSGYGRSGGHHRAWNPGHYEARPHQVWVPAYSHQVWHPARHETRYNAHGIAFQFQLSVGYYEAVHVPGRYMSSSRRVWIAGHWSH